jgi:hypothetical protein
VVSCIAKGCAVHRVSDEAIVTRVLFLNQTKFADSFVFGQIDRETKVVITIA